MKKPKIISIGVLLISSIVFIAFMPAAPQDNWPVPDEYKNMENPIPGENVAAGETLYMKHCRMCHGNNGEAGTPKARRLQYDGKLYGEAIDSQTDGEIYYKSIIGRPDTGMPNYEQKIKDENDRWAIVNFIRTLEE